MTQVEPSPPSLATKVPFDNTAAMSGPFVPSVATETCLTPLLSVTQVEPSPPSLATKIPLVSAAARSIEAGGFDPLPGAA